MARKSSKIERGVRFVFETKGAAKVDRQMGRASAGFKKTGQSATRAAGQVDKVGFSFASSGRAMEDSLKPIDDTFKGFDRIRGIVGQVTGVIGLGALAVQGLMSAYKSLTTDTKEQAKAQAILNRQSREFADIQKAITGISAEMLAGLSLEAVEDLARANATLTTTYKAQVKSLENIEATKLAMRQLDKEIAEAEAERSRLSRTARTAEERERLVAAANRLNDLTRDRPKALARLNIILAKQRAEYTKNVGAMKEAQIYAKAYNEEAAHIATSTPAVETHTDKVKAAANEWSIFSLAIHNAGVQIGRFVGETGDAMATALTKSIVAMNEQNEVMAERLKLAHENTKAAIATTQSNLDMGASAGEAAGQIAAASILQGESVKTQVAAVLEAKATQYMIESGAATAQGVIASVTGNGGAAAGFFAAAGIWAAMATAAGAGASMLGGSGGGGGGGGSAPSASEPATSQGLTGDQAGEDGRQETFVINVNGLLVGDMDQLDDVVNRSVSRARSRDDGLSARGARLR